MSLNSKVHALHLQKLEAENMVVRIAVDKLQVEREKERDEILWKAKTETRWCVWVAKNLANLGHWKSSKSELGETRRMPRNPSAKSAVLPNKLSQDDGLAKAVSK